MSGFLFCVEREDFGEGSKPGEAGEAGGFEESASADVVGASAVAGVSAHGVVGVTGEGWCGAGRDGLVGRSAAPG